VVAVGTALAEGPALIRTRGEFHDIAAVAVKPGVDIRDPQLTTSSTQPFCGSRKKKGPNCERTAEGGGSVGLMVSRDLVVIRRRRAPVCRRNGHDVGSIAISFGPVATVYRRLDFHDGKAGLL
jgi:hypothetical protein